MNASSSLLSLSMLSLGLIQRRYGSALSTIVDVVSPLNFRCNAAHYELHSAFVVFITSEFV